MSGRKTTSRSFLRIGWWVLLGVAIFLAAFPINVGLIRLLLLIAVPVLAIGACILLWSRKWLRWLPVALLILPLGFLLAPGHGHDTEQRRKRYVAALRRYEGTRYVWGGENRFGIDCSGLVRRGLIDANLREGVLTVNPRPVRAAGDLWWHDCSAKALKDGYRNWTRLLFTAPAINDIAPGRLAPGDIAVTSNGVHVLVYLGEDQWMQADPGPGNVVRQSVPVETGRWFETPVHVLRWRQLDERAVD
jgi:NlpC/P60 family protein